MGKLSDRTAIVTGGGTGIGFAIGVALASEGCRVLIAGRRAEVLQKAIVESPVDPPMISHAVDVSSRTSVKSLFDFAREQFKQIDILVNSAGTNFARRTIANTDPDEWDQTLAINATGAFNCARVVLPAMRERNDGLIVNISSIAGVRASTLGGVAYSASKFAMTALGTAMALEVGDDGVRVTNVHPGEVETPILERRPTPVSAEHRATILQPEDLGAAVLMIACLPARAHVSDMVIKPTTQAFA